MRTPRCRCCLVLPGDRSDPWEGLIQDARPIIHHQDALPRLEGGKRRKRGKVGAMPVEGSEVFPPLPPEVVALLQVHSRRIDFIHRSPHARD